MKIDSVKKSPSWLWKMAWRDTRKSKGRLLLFVSSIVLGIAALVAINSFSENLQRSIDLQSRELLGADIALRNNQPISDSIQQLFDTLGGVQAKELRFASMVYFPKAEGTRLIQVRFIEGDFPFYGEMETEPASAAKSFRSASKPQAIADRALLMQYGVQVGDQLKIGDVTFEVAGSLLKIPGQNNVSATIAPVVFLPLQFLEASNLVKQGSRIQYYDYFTVEKEVDLEDYLSSEPVTNLLDTEGVRVDTVASRKERVGNTFKNLTEFFSLIGFVALLLGSVGVASAIHVHVKGKIRTIAVLRCLGVSSWQAFYIFLIQIACMGGIGAFVGALLGSALQFLIPKLVENFLPVEVEVGLSWVAISQGILIGVVIAVLFALLPLFSVRKVSPLTALRASYGTAKYKSRATNWIYATIVILIFLFAYLQVGTWERAMGFTGGAIGAFLLLVGVAQLVIWGVKKYYPTGLGYLWRQSLANLFRPNNQTLILIVSIGLGTTLIATLYLTQDMLLNEVSMSSSKGAKANMVLFDIQTDQKNSIYQVMEDKGLPLLQEAPIVTMRLLNINGKTKQDVLADSTLELPKWLFNREYRVTYRDTLISSETTLEGSWNKPTVTSEATPISVGESFAKNMNAELGDKLIFNVQGVQIITVIQHIRKIDWRRVQTNFWVLFPNGVLEKAPQFHVLMTRVDSDEASAKLQQLLVKDFPNVSIIDLSLILKTLDEVLGEVSLVIQFMASFSIITGFLVLIAAVAISKYQREQESVLLKTLGAVQKQVLMITTVEYLLLGTLAALSGIGIALLGGTLLSLFVFDAAFIPNITALLSIFITVIILTVAIGVLNSKSALDKTPLEVLRG